MALEAGIKLGRYEIRSKLGAGGMGEVYLAQDMELDRTVAIKILPERLAADPQRLQRFIQEAKAASALNHPNIITIYDIDSEYGCDYIAMELVPGRTLDDIITRRRPRLPDALRYAVQIQVETNDIGCLRFEIGVIAGHVALQSMWLHPRSYQLRDCRLLKILHKH
jgi:serine/threonine protein kinase